MVVFPAHQMHRVTRVSFGQRVSLVGWVEGEATEHFWDDKEAVMVRTVERAEQEDSAGIPADLLYHTLQSFNTRLLIQSNWERLLAMAAKQIDLTGKLFSESSLSRGSLHAEQLGLALLEYSMAASSIGNSGPGITKQLAQKAWASCERASWLLADTAHALDGMRAWERVIGPQKRPPRPREEQPMCCDWPGHAKMRLN